MDPDRFLKAQAPVYGQVLAELRDGRKRTHWMWFIFPQLAGLGHSETARFFSLPGIEDAGLYLSHPVLGPRLLECTRIMLDWTGRKSPLDILGPVDSLKFRSSMTLFEVAAKAVGKATDARPDGASPFSRAIESLCDGARDPLTCERISA